MTVHPELLFLSYFSFLMIFPKGSEAPKFGDHMALGLTWLY